MSSSNLLLFPPKPFLPTVFPSLMNGSFDPSSCSGQKPWILPRLLPPSHKPHIQSISKFCQRYSQHTSRIQSLIQPLIPSTTTLAKPHLDYSSLALSLNPFIIHLFPTSQTSHSSKWQLDELAPLLKPSSGSPSLGVTSEALTMTTLRPSALPSALERPWHPCCPSNMAGLLLPTQGPFHLSLLLPGKLLSADACASHSPPSLRSSLDVTSQWTLLRTFYSWLIHPPCPHTPYLPSLLYFS